VAAIGLITLLWVAPAVAYDMRSGGVVCDDRQRICYDQDGPSLKQTGRRYGSNAERKLWRQLSGRPASDTAILSSGELCDFRRRLCWDDGWKRTNPSNRLSRHLFGSNLGRPDESRDGRRCELSRRNKRIFSGSCRFYRAEERGRPTYVVTTGDGRRYRFVQRSDQLWLSDATGTWRVSTRRNRDTLRFRWADLQLDVDRYRDDFSGRAWDDQRIPDDSELGGQIIQQLLEGLFR
jgi:hypothetical protein